MAEEVAGGKQQLHLIKLGNEQRSMNKSEVQASVAQPLKQV